MRIGSLFSGYGGLDQAAEAFYGAQTAWVSDIDPGACKVLAHRYPGVPNLGDITRINWADVEPVDILTGGYPCQPFSKSGKRKGTKDERHLWPYVREAIRYLRPRVTVLENVAGHRSLGFDRVLGDMAEDGLDVRWTSLRAADVGAPHNRERVFLLVADPSRQRHGEWENSRRVGRMDSQDESQAQQRERARTLVGSRTRTVTVAHTDSSGLQGSTHATSHAGAVTTGGDTGTFDWRAYTNAVRRWEEVLGRTAPAPNRVDARFQEWMMGLPLGWVTKVPNLTQPQQVKALGNGVVPQQAYAALQRLEGVA